MPDSMPSGSSTVTTPGKPAGWRADRKAKNFRQISEPLEDMSYERFLRLRGIFDSIPPDDLKKHAAMAERFGQKADGISALINPERTQFVSADASDLVHNLLLLLLRLLPLELLDCFVGAFREDFREAVGDAAYQRYLASDGYVQLCNPNISSTALERLLRADAIFIVNETRRQMLGQRHIEETRAFLLRTLGSGWRRVVVPLVVFLTFFFGCKLVADFYVFDAEAAIANSVTATAPTVAPSFIDKIGPSFISENRVHFQEQTGETDDAKRDLPKETAVYEMLIASALLSLAAVAGACGAYVSVVNRIQGITDSSKIGRNIWVLKNTSSSVAYAPALGAIFALILSFVIAGGLISGSLFPHLRQHWFFTLWAPEEMAKWLVWAFIAGFSERLVPDMLDRLTASGTGEDKSETITKSAPKFPPPDGASSETTFPDVAETKS